MATTLESVRKPTTDGLETLDDKGNAPETRLRDAGSARSLYLKFFEADRTAAFNRAAAQSMFDGDPPYEDSELIAAGQGYRCNVNFDEAGDLLDKAMASYIDMLQSVEVLASGMTNWGPDIDTRIEYSEEIMESFSNMVRGWKGFVPRFLLNSTYFVGHGLSFAVFDDPHDWRPEIDRLGNIQIPRDAKASEDDLEVVFRRTSYQVHQLYEKIRSKGAGKRGWDVEATKKELLKATRGYKATGRADQGWEKWVEEAKNNDMHMSAKSSEVDVIHCWVQEFSGKISHYIFPANAPAKKAGQSKGDEPFLFEDRNRYDDMSQAMTAFSYGVGTNGFFHGLRGLGYKIFPHVQISNRLHCQLVDGSMLASSLLLQPRDASDMHKLAMSYMGPYAVLHPGLSPVDKGTPNFSQNSLPVLNHLRNMLQNKTRGYTPSEALPVDAREMSRFEASARVQQAAGLTITNMVLFYIQYDGLLREMFRRASKKNYPEELPGGKEVKAFREELEAKGVPLEALYDFDIDSIEAIRATGAGSQSARDEIYRELTDLSPAFDPAGRQRLVRDRVASKLNSFRMADRYIKRPEQPRLPIDANVADLENNQLLQGLPVEVKGTELHLIHLQSHTTRIKQLLEAIDNGQADVLQEVRPGFRLVEGLVALRDHGVGHLEVIQGDPTAEQDVAQYRQVLQQAGEAIMNGIRELEAERRQGGGEGQEGEMSPEDQEHIRKMQQNEDLFNQKIRHSEQEFALKQHQQLLEADQKRALEQAKEAAKLSPTANL